MPAQTSKTLAEAYPAVTFGVLVSILGVFLALFVYYFLRRNKDRDAVRYTIIADIQALIVTVFTVFVTVVTGVSAKLAEANLVVVGFVVSISGPFVLWLVARRILAPTSARLAALFQASTSHDELIARCEHSLGWQSYVDWRASLGPFARTLTGSGELQFINDMLPRVFYDGDVSIVRPSSPSISTVFVYPEGGPSFKIQSIRGSYLGSGNRPQVFLPGTASAPGGRVASAYFLRIGETVKEIGTCRNGEWLQVPYESFEVCVASVYYDDDTYESDYIAIDTSKYLSGDEDVGIELDVTIAASRPIERPRSWDMSASVIGSRKPAPLIFRGATHPWISAEESRKVVRHKLDASVKEMLRLASGGGQQNRLADVRNLIVEIESPLKQLSAWLDSGTGASNTASAFSTFSCTRRRQRHVFVSVFDWQSSVSVPSTGDTE